MNTLKLSFLALALAVVGSLHCGGGSNDRPDAILIPVGAGGSGGGGTIGSYDAPPATDIAITSDTGVTPPLDTAGGSETTGTTVPPPPSIGCQGLTEAQCHDSIINPLSLPASIQTLDPGANPAMLYPSCTAL